MNGQVMCKFLTHSVLRAYTALARGEQYAPSEIGTLDFIAPYSGRLIASFPLTQVNYFANEDVEAAIENHWSKDSAEIFKAGVFANPGRLANRLICQKLKAKFGALNEKVPQFDKNDLLNIPKGCDFIVPKREGSLIEKFLFYRMQGNIKQI